MFGFAFELVVWVGLDLCLFRLVLVIVFGLLAVGFVCCV